MTDDLPTLLRGRRPDDPWWESAHALAVLGDPHLRAEIYRAIHPGGDPMSAVLLRALLVAEVRHRARELDGGEDEDDDDDDHFEQLYWCAYLLADLGDPVDVPRLWRAKHTTFDTSIGMDIQCLVGGVGVDATLTFLETSDDPDASKIAAHVRACCDAGDFDDLAGWRAHWRAYFGGCGEAAHLDASTERLAAPASESHSPPVESIAPSLRFTSPGPSRAPGGRRTSD